MDFYEKQVDRDGRLGRYLCRAISLLVCLFILGFCLKIFFNREDFREHTGSSFIDGAAEVEIRRGAILDRSGNPLAVSLVDSSVYVKPREFADLSGTTGKLAELLGLNAEDLLTELKTQKSFIWLARHIPHNTARKIAELDLSGVYIISKVNRVYPHNFKVPGIIGEVSLEEGLSGLEYYYNDLLLGGKEGRRSDIYLTLDLNTQMLLENKLPALLKEVKSDAATDKQTVIKAIVMNAETGGIIACAQRSSGPAANVSSLSLEQQTHRFFSDYLDPGAFEELFRLAATWKVGRKEPSDNATAGVRVIMPTGIKKEINPPKRPAWQSLRNGALVGPWFARLLDRKELFGSSGNTDPLSILELAAFSAGLGFSSPVIPDLPREEFVEPQGKEGGTFLVDEDAEVLPLNLLAGFSCLVTGRYQQPHFYKETDPGLEGNLDQGKEINGSICEGLEEQLLTRFRRISGSGDHVYVMESLQPEGDGPIDSKELEWVNGAVLALARGEHDLVMLLTIENHRIDPFNPPSFKSDLTEFLSAALMNLNRQEESIKFIEEKYLNTWLLTADKKKADPDVEPLKIMPDLRGMSLRQALRRLKNSGVRISIHGSGIVTEQSPGPGEVVKNAECVLIAEFNKRPGKKDN